MVLLHGFPETSYAWRKVMPVLAQRYTVIAPDLRGCGASTGLLQAMTNKRWHRTYGP